MGIHINNIKIVIKGSLIINENQNHFVPTKKLISIEFFFSFY